MSKAFTAISYLEDPEHFLRALGEVSHAKGIISPDQFLSEDKYQQAVEGDHYQNLSFFQEQEGDIKTVVLAHKIGDVVRYNHLGVEIVALEEGKKTIVQAFGALMGYAKAKKVKTVLVDDRGSSGDLSLVGTEAFNYNGAPQAKLEAVVDLTRSEEEIHRNLRKSYKSLINQGRKEMTFVYVRGAKAEKNLFDDFRAFHKRVAGRTTRSEDSWNTQYDMVKEEQAELILGYLEPHGLVSSALFNDVGKLSVYSVAVYNRDLFDYPLAHANVYEGLIRAKERGQKMFYLGQIAPYGSVEEKEFNIGKFKKGFCNTLKSYIEWHIPVESVKNIK